MSLAPRGEDWFWLGISALVFPRLYAEARTRKRARDLLLDLRTSRARWYGLVSLLVVGLSLLVLAVPRIRWVGFLLLGLGYFMLAAAPKRFQLRERGILCPGKLIPWDKIESYELSSIGTLSLKMPGKKWTFCGDVPPGLRQKAQDLLASKCQARPQTT
jgi:hypothetical protein